MLDALKPLVVVLAIALIVFAVAKPLCLKFMEPSTFARRRNVWLILTCAGFLTPNIWLFAVVALPVIYWAASVDRHPTALYLLLLLVVPPAAVSIPLPVVNRFFDLTPYRILALALLVPTAVRIIRSGRARAPGLVPVDLLLLAYGVLQLVLYMPYETFTNTLRRAFLFGLDTYVLYFVFSRSAGTIEALKDTMASFWLACVILVPITVFESAKGWLLYTGIPSRWGSPNVFSWLFREDALRAQASAGHSLAMGYLFAIAFGFWLYLGGRVQSKRLLWAIGCFMWLGLFATFSRAPWIVAAAVLFAFMWLAPAGRRHLVGTAVGLVAAGVAVSLTSLGARMIATLPFIGTAAQGNVDYRQQLATISWQLIKQNPVFGNPFALNYMEDLRQGQGIIDLVNTYAAVALFYGLVGLAFFVACFAYPALRSFMVMRANRVLDPEAANLGAALVACMLGTLLMMAAGSFGTGFEKLSWVMAGLCGAYTVAMRAALTPQPETAAWALRHAPPMPGSFR